MLIYFVDGGFIRSSSTEALFTMDNTTKFPVTKSFGSSMAHPVSNSILTANAITRVISAK